MIMKKLFVSIFILAFAASESRAQWQRFPFDNPAAFGFHDTSFFASQQGGGVYRYDSGSWVIADNGLASGSADKAVTCFGSIGTSFLAAANGTSGSTYIADFRSTNNGSSWSEILPRIQSNCFLTWGKYIYSGGAGGVDSSGDSGMNWTHFSTSPHPVNALARMDTILFAGTTAGIYRSTDRGNSWHILDSGIYVTTMTTVGTYIFAGTDGSGIFRSTDEGEHWLAANTGLTIGSVTCIVAYKNALFTGTYGHGVFLSTDSGATWDTVSVGLPSGEISTLCIFDTFLIAGVEDGFGTGSYSYIRPISEMVKKDTTSGVVQQIPTGDSIEVYPNPTLGTVTIYGSIALLDVSVVNVLGEEMLDIPRLNEQSFTFDLSKFPSGTYFLRIATLNGVVLRKVIRE
jgi:Secretion system C-terminal sorting domain